MNNSTEQKKQFAKDSLIYLIGNSFIGLAGVLSISLYTKLFSPVQYGDYSIVIGTLGLVLSIVVGWLNQSIVRFNDYYTHNSKSKEFYSTIFSALLLINIVVVITGLILLNIFRQRFNNYSYSLYMATIFLFIPESAVNILNSVVRAVGKSKLYTTNNVIVSVGKLVLVFLLAVIFRIDVKSIIYSLIISDVIVIILTFKKMKLWNNIQWSSYSKNIFKELFNYGIPLLGISVTTWVLDISDRYIIKIFKSSYEVGIYSVSYSLSSSIFNILASFMMLSAYPIIVNAWNNQGKESTEQLIESMLRYYFMIVVPAFIGIAILSQHLLTVFSSAEYANGYLVMILVSLGTIFVGISQYTNKVWELTKNTKMILLLNISAAIINVVLNLLLVPRFGYNVAALNTTISYAIYLIISLLMSKNIFKIKVPAKSIIKIFFASLTMGGFVYLILLVISNKIIAIVVSIIVGMVVYTGVLYITREINEEIKMLLSRFRK